MKIIRNGLFIIVVGNKRVELLHQKVLEPKSSASTNSANLPFSYSLFYLLVFIILICVLVPETRFELATP